MRRFRFNGADWQPDHPDWPARMALAYGNSKQRIQCLCQPTGVDMYVQKRNGQYLVKRMPNGGQNHHPDCDSYLPPPELSGASQIDGQAVKEDPETGITTLKLDFALSRRAGKAPDSQSDTLPEVASTSGTKLTLRSLLQLLWQDAGFNKWTPAMHGKRSWYVIRKYLLEAIEDKQTRNAELKNLLFIPESYSPDKQAEIAVRRQQAMAPANPSGKRGQSLMLIVGEVKDIQPSRSGHKFVLKHLPDCHLFMDNELYKRLQKYFALELDLWNGLEQSHLMLIGTFQLTESGFAVLQDVSLMNVTQEWLPFETREEYQLILAMIEQQRRFAKGLRFNLPLNRPLASLVATDTKPQATAMYIQRTVDEEYEQVLQELIAGSQLASWVWDATRGEMPALPSRQPVTAPV